MVVIVSGASGEVTKLSAVNSLFIVFRYLGLGGTRGARWPCAVYMVCQECSSSTMIFVCLLRREQGGEGKHCAAASSITPGLHVVPDAWLLVWGWRLKPRGQWGADGGLLGNPGHGISLCPGAITCWHGRSFLPFFIVSPDFILPVSPLNNEPIYLFPFSL